MKILYVTPYPPLKNGCSTGGMDVGGIAYYVYYFKNTIEQNFDI